MKHKTLAILLLIMMLIAGSGSALAQGATPPTGAETLPKSEFMSPAAGSRGEMTPAGDAGPLATTQPVQNGSFEQGPTVDIFLKPVKKQTELYVEGRYG